MSKQRYINTKMWSDSWIADLDPVEKLLFLYLLTNERTNIAGIYELPLKIMAVETGIEKEMIEKILKRFERDNKVIFKDNYIGIKNFIKHQDTASEKILKGINTILSDIPRNILDTLYIPYPYPSNYSNIIKYNTIAETSSADKMPTKEDMGFNYQSYLDGMKSNKCRHINIIRVYWINKEYDFKTQTQAQAQLKRDLKPAKDLVDYPNEKIIEVINFCKAKFPLWTLETVGKLINNKNINE